MREKMSTLPKCSCGHGIESKEVQNLPEYSFWGWLTFSIGITTSPKRIRFQCLKCREIFHEINEPEELKKFLGY